MTSATRPNPKWLLIGTLAVGAMLPLAAQAYVGPGAGLSLLTALWGIIAAIGMALFFVVMWPIRRARRRRKAAAAAKAGESPAASQPSPSATAQARTADSATDQASPQQDPESPPTTRQVDDSMQREGARDGQRS